MSTCCLVLNCCHVLELWFLKQSINFANCSTFIALFPTKSKESFCFSIHPDKIEVLIQAMK